MVLPQRIKEVLQAADDLLKEGKNNESDETDNENRAVVSGYWRE